MSDRGPVSAFEEAANFAMADDDLWEAFNNLSPRQRQCAEMIYHGFSTKEAARSMGISPRTAEIHVACMKTALNIKKLSQIPLAVFKVKVRAVYERGAV